MSRKIILIKQELLLLVYELNRSGLLAENEKIRPILRSEERFSRNAETDLVCRLLLEKKKKQEQNNTRTIDNAHANSGGTELPQYELHTVCAAHQRDQQTDP